MSATTTGRSNPSLSGSSGLDNLYVVDGVNVTNTGYGAIGSYSIVFGSLGNATPFDFIKEVQVKTGGYEAEFGQSMGGVVNVVTKSGTNTLRGSVFGYLRPDALEEARHAPSCDLGVVRGDERGRVHEVDEQRRRELALHPRSLGSATSPGTGGLPNCDGVRR